MPVTVSYPGVYVQEQASGSRAIAGVATSVALFIGMARQGRLDTPVQLFSFADFEREFGSATGGELGQQVRQFYLNGGGTAWVCRIADGALQAAVTLNDEQEQPCLTLTARDHGAEANLIRAEVDYDTASPERTFNLTVYKSRLLADGTRTREQEELFPGLSMDPGSGSYVDTVVAGNSQLVRARASQANAPTGAGASISGLVFPTADADANNAIAGLVTANSNAIRIRVDNNPPVTCAFATGADLATTLNNIETAIEQTYSGAGVAVDVVVELLTEGDSLTGGRILRIGSNTGPVVISQAAQNDVSVALRLGAAAGGIEADQFGDIRPAPSGLVSRNGTSANNFAGLRSFAGTNRDQLTGFTLADDSGDANHGGGVAMNLGGAVPMYEVGGARNLGNVLGALDVLATTLTANTNQRWVAARHGLRLVLRPKYGGSDTGLAGVLTTDGGLDFGDANQMFDPASHPENVAAYTVGQTAGVGGAGNFQDGAGATPGDDGNTPQPNNYDDIYATVERDVDLFNIMVLPRAEGQTDDQQQALWGAASAFCAKERAMLIIDPRSDWTDIAAAKAGVKTIRIGVETRNAAVYWPRITPAGTKTSIAPSGSMAGLWARTDANRGVWKAPAGLEATIRGVNGVERNMSDPENGQLNPEALNAIRVFPAGVVSWGARTLVGFDGSGNVDDKYIPVRRTMLFIEESLYRGLHFAVFEPNDEPLWAQIRLAAGSFMNGLFRQGAFAGAKAFDAYFVKCDGTTTTANDINLGIVNVIVGFAPLKPAEFVVLTVTQIAGQVQV